MLGIIPCDIHCSFLCRHWASFDSIATDILLFYINLWRVYSIFVKCILIHINNVIRGRTRLISLFESQKPTIKSSKFINLNILGLLRIKASWSWSNKVHMIFHPLFEIYLLCCIIESYLGWKLGLSIFLFIRWNTILPETIFLYINLNVFPNFILSWARWIWILLSNSKELSISVKVVAVSTMSKTIKHGTSINVSFLCLFKFLILYRHLLLKSSCPFKFKEPLTVAEYILVSYGFLI